MNEEDENVDFSNKMDDIKNDIKAISYSLNTTLITTEEEKYIDFTQCKNFSRTIDVVQNDIPVFCRISNNPYKLDVSKLTKNVTVKFTVYQIVE